MYTGSAAFQTANAKNIQKQKVRGTIDSVSFTGANILGGSLTVTNQITDQSDAKIGSVYVGKLTCTFLNNTGIGARTWRGRKIALEFGLCISENPDTYEWFKVGTFFVSEANANADGVVVTAYDAMSFFDEALPSNYTLSGSPFGIAQNVCQICGVTLGQTEAQIRVLPNGTEPLGMYTPNDCVTYRDIIYWLSVTLGGWATINREGKLVFGTYQRTNTAVDTIGADQRATGATFSDWVTDFGSAQFQNDDGSVEVIGSVGVGVSYNVGFDPFLQFGTYEHRSEMRDVVFRAINNIKFMPFKCEMISAPIYDLGDIVDLTGGVATSRQHIGCVQSVSWTMSKGLTIAGYGADPNLRVAQTDKEAANSAAQRATQASEIIYKDYMNLSPITVDSTETQVVNIDFISNKKTNVEMWHEIQLETALGTGQSSMTVEAVYYMDGQEKSRHPIETFTDSAKHILDLHFFQWIDEPGSHTWQVFLEATGGTVSINSRDVFAVLKGQGLSNIDSWTGIIILDDAIPRLALEIDPRAFTGAVTCSTQTPDYIVATDSVSRYPIEIGVRAFSEAVTMVLEFPVFGIVSEDKDYNILSEDKDYNVVSED